MSPLRSCTHYRIVCGKPIACIIKRAVLQRGDCEGTFNICSHQAQLAQLLNVNQSKQIIFLTPRINHRTSLPISHRWLIRCSPRLPLITQQMRRSLETRLIVLFSYDIPLSNSCIIHHYSSTNRGISMGTSVPTQSWCVYLQHMKHGSKKVFNQLKTDKKKQNNNSYTQKWTYWPLDISFSHQKQRRNIFTRVPCNSKF